jgi:hypothetical protein
MRFTIVAMFFSAVLASVSPVTSVQAANGWYWYVILGSFPYWDRASTERQWSYVTHSCGLEAAWEDAINVEGLNSNVLFVYEGPFTSKARAYAYLREAQGCVADAFIKRGRPGGE